MNPGVPLWPFLLGSAAFGIIWLVVGLRVRGQTAHLLRVGKEAPAEVVGGRIDGGGPSARGATRFARYRFTTEAGEERFVESVVGLAFLGPRAGERATVLYDPADPERARVKSWAELRLLWLLPVVLGVAFLLVAVGLGVASAW